MFDVTKYRYGNPGTYNIFDNNLVITHSSVQNRYEEKIKEIIAQINEIDLSIINTIIDDISGNTGGNSAYNKSLIDFLRKSRKKIICLTDYRVFSGGINALSLSKTKYL